MQVDPTPLTTPTASMRATFQLTTLLLAALLASCSKAQTELPYTKPADWVTHCIGRYLVDMPPKVLDPATVIKRGSDDVHPVAYEVFGGYAPPNEGDFGLGHVRYDGYQIGESLPVDEVTFKMFAIPGMGSRYSPLRHDVAQKFRQMAFEDRRVVLRKVDRIDMVVHRDDGSVLYVGREMHDQDQSDAGAAERAWKVISDFQARYRQRDPLDIPSPSVPGVCTPRGFISEQPGEVPRNVELQFVPYQNPAEPALIYEINIKAAPQPPRADSIESLPLPYAETEEDRKERIQQQSPGFRGGGWERYLKFDSGPDVRARIGPEFFDIAGQPGRLSGAKLWVELPSYYEAHAETLGRAENPRAPEITLVAAGMRTWDTPSLENRPKPPDLEVAHKTLRNISRSLRLRVPPQ